MESGTSFVFYLHYAQLQQLQSTERSLCTTVGKPRDMIRAAMEGPFQRPLHFFFVPCRATSLHLSTRAINDWTGGLIEYKLFQRTSSHIWTIFSCSRLPSSPA